MNIKTRNWMPILIGLVLGIFFGAATGKLLQYSPAGLIIGVLISIAFGVKKNN